MATTRASSSPRLAISAARAQQDGLQRHGADARRQAAGAQQAQVGQDQQDASGCRARPASSHLNTSTRASTDSTEAATSSCGTRTSRSRAIDRLDDADRRGDGQDQRDRRPRSRAATTPCAPAAGRRPAARRDTQSFRPAPYWMKAEVGPAVVQHHHLVDHGQLQVGVRVVHRDARVLRQQDDREGRRDQHEQRPARAGQLPAREPRRACPLSETLRGVHRQRRQPEEQRRLGQRRERSLAAGAHALEAEPVSSAASDGDEAHQPQQVGEQQEVARERERRPGPRRAAAIARQASGRGQPDHRAGAEDPGRGAAVDRPFAQQLREVVVGLQERLPGAARRRRPWSG